MFCRADHRGGASLVNLIRRNILWLMVSQLATWTATFAALVIVPNKLGSTNFGTLAYGRVGRLVHTRRRVGYLTVPLVCHRS